MIFDREKFITTLSAIFIIVIFSSTNIQGLMNTKLRKELVENPYIKHSILLISIYTMKTYEIINFTGNDDNDDIKLNIIKSVMVWLMLLFFFKINFYCIISIIGISLLSNAANDMNLNKKTKNNFLMGSNYLILFIYIYGVYEYLMKTPERSSKSVIDSLFKTIN